MATYSQVAREVDTIAQSLDNLFYLRFIDKHRVSLIKQTLNEELEKLRRSTLQQSGPVGLDWGDGFGQAQATQMSVPTKPKKVRPTIPMAFNPALHDDYSLDDGPIIADKQESSSVASVPEDPWGDVRQLENRGTMPTGLSAINKQSAPAQPAIAAAGLISLDSPPSATAGDQLPLGPMMPVPVPAPAPAPAAREPEGNKKNGVMVCPFWITGNDLGWFKFGCGFYRDHGDFVHSKPPGVPIEPLECPFWRKGRCVKDTRCMLAHSQTLHGCVAKLPKKPHSKKDSALR